MKTYPCCFKVLLLPFLVVSLPLKAAVAPSGPLLSNRKEAPHLLFSSSTDTHNAGVCDSHGRPAEKVRGLQHTGGNFKLGIRRYCSGSYTFLPLSGELLRGSVMLDPSLNLPIPPNILHSLVSLNPKPPLSPTILLHKPPVKGGKSSSYCYAKQIALSLFQCLQAWLSLGTYPAYSNKFPKQKSFPAWCFHVEKTGKSVLVIYFFTCLGSNSAAFKIKRQILSPEDIKEEGEEKGNKNFSFSLYSKRDTGLAYLYLI